VIAQRLTEALLIHWWALDSRPLLRAVLRTVSLVVGMRTPLLHASQTRLKSLSLVRIVLLMLLDMLTTIAGQGTAPLINVAQVVQIALRQPSTPQKSAWAVTLSNEDTLLQCINHAGLEYLEWSVLMIVHKTQDFLALPPMIAQFGVVPNVLEARASAAQVHAV